MEVSCSTSAIPAVADDVTVIVADEGDDNSSESSDSNSEGR
jgi:hypothetical protein